MTTLLLLQLKKDDVMYGFIFLFSSSLRGEYTYGFVFK